MDLAVTADQVEERKPSVSLPFPNAWWGRVIYGIYVIALSTFSFWATNLFKPEWQSGRLSAYIVLFLFPEAALVFIILLAYSVICYLLLLTSPLRYSRLFFIRLGVYAGTLLAFQYSILSGLFFLDDSFAPLFIPVWIFPLVFGPVYRRSTGKWGARTVNIFLILLFIGALLVSTLLLPDPSNMPLLLLMLLTMSAPFWCFLLALRAARWLFKNYETRFNVPRGLGLSVWLAAYAVAWRFDLLKMFELYAALPKEPPNCYIATAAARGHPRFVQSWEVQRAHGRSWQVNQQLQRLKCAELALLAVQPRWHRLLRAIYDVIGKSLARRIQNPFFADLAYLFLKPWEWSARFLLKIMLPEIDSISKRMYM